MSNLFTIEATVFLPFCIISHPYSSSIKFHVEGQLCIILILCRVVIVNVWGNVVFLCLYPAGGFYLCSVDGDIGVVIVVIVILPVLMQLILLNIIWLMLMRVGVVNLIGGSVQGPKLPCSCWLHTPLRLRASQGSNLCGAISHIYWW